MSFLSVHCHAHRNDRDRGRPHNSGVTEHGIDLRDVPHGDDVVVSYGDEVATR